MVHSQSDDIQAAAHFRPAPAHVVAAVASLYKNRLKPFGRILIKRVGELAADITANGAHCVSTAEGFIPRIDSKHLLRICRQCPQLRVEDLDYGEYAAVLVGWPPAFVDIDSTDDPYPQDLWVDLRAYFDGPADSHPPLPGSRYNSARALKARNLPCLQDLCLGEVCHVLALAVSQKKVLGHSRGHIVPYRRSENGRKTFCAGMALPVNGGKLVSSGLVVATWAQLTQGLQELLADSSDKGASGIPIPNVKRLFRSRLGLELSETALGHLRVQDLLQDARLRSVCEIRRQGAKNNFVVVGRPAAPPDEGAPSTLPGAVLHYEAPVRKVEPTCKHAPPSPGPCRESGQPVWISPTLLESIWPRS
ncbi:unnamed protein product [Prorocentrum cordatum]|uniref:HTH OST-type domain-containing protein n=1 Tax=Prorocentrum cordatum TaxID=2364126 RepID=A0ABN9Y6W3_9DINO|nr:unnamed protein product [Polarella glacialis]